MSSVSIELDRDIGAYRPGQLIRGRVRIVGAGPGPGPAHVRIRIQGQVILNLSPKAVGLFEAFYSSLKPISILERILKLTRSERASDSDSNVCEYPFEFELHQAADGQSLISSYQGRLVRVEYDLAAFTGRAFLASGPAATRRFVVTAYGPRAERRPCRAPFKSHGYSQSQATDDSNEAQVDLEVDIEGAIHNTLCSMQHEPLQGEITILRSTKQITSITATLNRIETCEYSEGAYSDKSEVHTVQVAVGNICRMIPIPIYMPWPRIRTCPSISHSDFSIAFEVEIRVHFATGQYMVERIPVRLY